MPSRKVPFVNGEFYHIFNRGVAKMPIFHTILDYKHFIRTLQYYSIDSQKPKFSSFMPLTTQLDLSKKIVKLVTYCLMPNHFHFLLQQVRENGITEFVSKISNSYTKYANTKWERVGPLFQGEFKSVHIGSNEQLIHLSRYIHLNPLVGYVAKDLEAYPWSSYREYVWGRNNGMCMREIILKQFLSQEAYKQFVLDQEGYAKNLEQIKHQLLEDEHER